MAPTTVLPGRTLGVLGSGQLGRMLALAARRMGYRVHCFSPDRDSPTGQIADRELVAGYDDLEAVRGFARGVDVVTFEFENVPSRTAEALASLVPVRPAGRVLHITQDRGREKTFLAGIDVPVTPFALVHTRAELDEALSRIGLPVILKTTQFGYDGKGQSRIDSAEDIDAAWQAHAQAPAQAPGPTPQAPAEAPGPRPQACMVEAVVDFVAEISVVGARGLDGTLVVYDPIENVHRHHILDVSVAPARVAPAVAAEAARLASRILAALDVVGVLCVEMFVSRDGRVLVNELAPRPHNSGHLTIEASATSQFEQQLRAVCGLPLGAVALRAPAAMANLLGDVWAGGEPDWAAACARPGVSLHLYGKHEPRPGRKMGHLTAVAATVDAAERMVIEARAALQRPAKV